MKKILLLPISFLLGMNVLLAGDSVTIASKKLDEMNEKIDKLQMMSYEKEAAVLKDGYATGITSINYFITVGLALITAIGALLGYIGFKNIAELKKNHQEELEKLKTLKSVFENNFTNFNTEFAAKQQSIDDLIKQFRSGLEKVEKQNLEQERLIEVQRLKFEIQFQTRKEKVDYDTLLELTNKALLLTPEDEYLLTYKALSHGKRHEYADAIAVIKKIPSTAKNSLFLQQNLAEIYLFTKKIPEFETLFNEYEKQFNSNRPATAAYLKAFAYYLKGEDSALKYFISTHIKPQKKEGVKDLLTSSQLLEFYSEADDFPESSSKQLLLDFVAYLKGEKTAQELTTHIASV